MSPSRPGTRPNDPLVGLTLGGCRLLSVLGRGGMGAVYKAHHLALDKPVAVKILAPHLAGDREYIGRFFQEARACARIEHPNVVQVLNVAAEHDQHFIIMGFVEGESVEQVLRRETRLGLGRATRIARAVAAGLGALHRAGIIHRDIKPANILVGTDGLVKITDFGLARSLVQKQGYTAAGAFMGTPEYVSPEQAEGRDLDARSDLYSLGVSYYQMLAGRLPFQGRSAVDVAAKHLRDQPPSLPSVAPDVDGRAVQVTQRLLQKDPAERYPDSKALIADLDRILEHLSTVVPNEPAPPRDPDPIFSQPTVQSPTPPVEDAAPPPPPSAPPPPPPRPSGPYAAGPVTGRKVRNAFRGFIFWVLVLLAWTLFFVTGALGATPSGDGVIVGVVESVASSESSAVLRLCLAGVAVVLFLIAFVTNRRVLTGSTQPVVGILFLFVSAAFFYAGGVHLPVVEGEEAILSRAMTGLFDALGRPIHLAFLAGWALLSGILLVAGGAERMRIRAAGTILIFLSLALLVLYASWGYWDHLTRFISEDMGGMLTAVSGAIVSLAGIFLAVKRKRHWALKGLGLFLVLLGAWALFQFGRQVSGFAETVTWKDATAGVTLAEVFTRQGGLVSLGLLLAIWTAWFLRSRSGFKQGQYPF